MKTKIAIGIVVLVVVVGGGWYMLKVRPNAPSTGDNQLSDGLLIPDAETPLISSTTQKTNTPQQQPTTQNPALKARAMQIIARPITFNTTLTDAQKQEITKQINEIKNQINTNYDNDISWLMLGNYRKSTKDYDGAIEAWNFLVTIRPKGYLAFHNLGSLYGFELHNYPKSEENFLKAIANAPQNIDAYSQLAVVYEAAKTPEKIEALLLGGITSNPNDASLKIMLGQYYAKVGRKAEALKYFEKALKLNPTNTELKIEIEELQK